MNRAFNEQFSELDEYKTEANFKRVLVKISLDDVRQAIQRAKGIMFRNKQNELQLVEYKGYKYYRDNPSLTIWESVEKILEDCQLS